MSDGVQATIVTDGGMGDDAAFHAFLRRLMHGQDTLSKLDLLTEALYSAWTVGGTWVQEALEDFVAHVERAGQGQHGREGPS